VSKQVKDAMSFIERQNERQAAESVDVKREKLVHDLFEQNAPSSMEQTLDESSTKVIGF
jgi:hypothetical protein